MTTRKMLGVVALGVFVVALILPVSSSAGQLLLRSSGTFASASFFSSDPSGCVFTSVFIDGSQNQFQQAPGVPTGSTGALVFLVQFDNCTLSFLEAFGFASSVDLRMNQGLTQARLTGHIPIFDCFAIGSQTCPADLAVDISWTATDRPSRQIISEHFLSPGGIANVQVRGSFTPAEAAGSVSSDGVTNLTPNPTNSAFMGSSDFHEVQVTTR